MFCLFSREAFLSEKVNCTWLLFFFCKFTPVVYGDVISVKAYLQLELIKKTLRLLYAGNA